MSGWTCMRHPFDAVCNRVMRPASLRCVFEAKPGHIELQCARNAVRKAFRCDFNKRRKVQTLIDPSLHLRSVNLFEYFQQNHHWGEEGFTCSVAHAERNSLDNVQGMFSDPTDKSDQCKLNGCCTTVTLLIIWMCLRLGCEQPELIMDSIHAAMLFMRMTEQKPLVKDFLLRFQAWHTGISRQNPADVPKWLKLTGIVDATGRRCEQRRPQISMPCKYITYDGDRMTFCDRLCSGGHAWCAMHLRGHAPVSPLRKVNTFVLLALPHTLDHFLEHSFKITTKIACVGHFERWWESNNYACSLDTLRKHIRRNRASPTPQHMGTTATRMVVSRCRWSFVCTGL